MATAKLCDSCKSAAPSMFCRADSAFLCVSCDARVHAANKLASRHARVWMCDVCEQAPAHVTCKADAASLCVSCDRDIHSANPLARRHERVPVVPFYDPVLSEEEDEAEAASWLLPAAAKPDPYACSFPNMVDPFLDLDYVDAKQEEEDASGDNNSSGTTDGVVPVQSQLIIPHHQLVTDHGSCFELDFSPLGASKPLPFPTYNFHSSTPCLSHSHSHSHSHSVSSSSMEVGVVPEGDIYSSGGQQVGTEQAKEAVALSGAEREARVLRYREKRKNRKFEKTIRYASRKAYAETRPRIKGRFAKRTDLDHDHDHLVDHRTHLFGFGVVPSY